MSPNDPTGCRAATRPPAPCSGAAAATLLLLLGAGSAGAEPFTPDRDDEVVATLEMVNSAGDDGLRRLRARLADDPDDLDLALRLAARYAELGRSRGDPRYDGYAEAALAPWTQRLEPPLRVLLLRAVLAQRRHDFDAALTILERVLERSPGHPQALLTRAGIYGVKGDGVAAGRDCLGLEGRVEPLIAAACGAMVNRLDNAGAAYGELLDAARRDPPAGPRIAVWVETLLGELASLRGDAATAEAHYRNAMEIDGRDVYLLAAFADLLLDLGRPDEVRALLAKYERVDPLLLRLAIAEDRLGDPARERHVRTLGDRFATARRRGDVVHRREQARFALELAGDPERAFDLALANLAVQREPADVDLLVDAALAAGRPGPAVTALQRLRRAGYVEAALDRLAAAEAT